MTFEEGKRKLIKRLKMLGYKHSGDAKNGAARQWSVSDDKSGTFGGEGFMMTAEEFFSINSI